MKRKYKEIFKLKRMLEDANIPFDWIEGWGHNEEQTRALKKIAPDLTDRYQICYPKGSFYNEETRWISVIEGFGTFGANQDKLEIMGGFTPTERFYEDYKKDDVKGYLTAQNVFTRIKNNWEETNYER